ncbi:MAG: DUF4376 domain-containing protein [Akkermansia sp.]|nr:DUF4376 domain-containing protein [Akkermansia sp.]
MEFKNGYIFESADGLYPDGCVEWCEKHRATLEELAPVNGVRRFQIVAIPEPTAEELAAQALEQAKAERAAAVAAITVTVDGMVFDGDEKAQERMARAVLMAESPEEQTEWVLHDNTVALVTADQLKRACRAAGKAQTALWTVPYEA